MELTKTQITDEFVEIHLRGVPSDKAELVREAIEKILNLVGLPLQEMGEGDDRLYKGGRS